jgi:uncharacterized membrane protein
MAETIDVNADGSVKDLGGETRILHVVYLLHALAPFTAWLLAVVAVIIGAFKRDDVRGTYLDSHYAWLGGAFWWALIWILVSWAVFWVITVLTLGLGAIVMWVVPTVAYVVLFVWYLYRVIRGWLRLNDAKPVE